MSLKIANNPISIFSSLQLQKTNQKLSNTLEQISSGSRINRAADDAASMTITDKMDSDIRGFGQTIRNANDKIAMIEISDGALQKAAEIVLDVRSKALQAAQDGQSPESRAALQADITKSLSSLDGLTKNTTYNGKKLIDEDISTLAFAVENSAGSTSTTTPGSDKTSSLAQINVTDQQGAQEALQVTDAALEYINGQRADLGAEQNQLSANIDNLSTTVTNLAAAQSSIADVDYAEQSMNFMQQKLLSQAQIFAQIQTGGINKKNILELLQG